MEYPRIQDAGGWNCRTDINAAEDYVAVLDADGKIHVLGSMGCVDRQPDRNEPLTAIAAMRNGVLGLTMEGKVLFHGRNSASVRGIAPDVVQ